MIIQINQTEINSTDTNESDPQDGDFGSSSDESKSAVGGRAARFFRKRLKIKNNLFKTCGS
jgi:hypothetical protein